MSEQKELIELIKTTRPHLEVTDVSEWSKAKWLDYRTSGLGCSELGSILGHNKYSEPAIIFAQKTGLVPTGSFDNEIMFMGRVMEPIVADLWEYYDPEIGTWEGTAKNMAEGTKMRKVLKPEVYVRNPKYPWLFGGPDGIFHHEGDRSVLEIKTIAKMAADQYISGIPTSYLYQIHGYMMLFECDYCEMAMLQDGRFLDVFPMERVDSIVDQIANECGEFWYRIEQAKELMGAGEEWTHLEPNPTDTEVYESFLKERFRAESGLEVLSDDSVEYWVNKYLSFTEQEKEKKKRKTYYSNKIKYYMGEGTEMKCEAAKVNWRESERLDKEGNPIRSFRVTKKKL
jgi:predicted phage-related endonuclease